jgi:hypothetical protein
MIAMKASVILLLVVLTAGAGFAVEQASQPAATPGHVELLAGLEAGLLQAEFRGNGDSSVVGRIRAAAGGPTGVTIQPGTQFWAQLGGGQGQLGQGNRGLSQLGGRQGLGALGQTDLKLTPGRLAQITLPAACTNLGLPAPTRHDIMIASRPPDARVAALAARYGEPGISHAACQVAIWAITDNPSRKAINFYLAREVRAAARSTSEAEVSSDSILASAAELLRGTLVQPETLALFR